MDLSELRGGVAVLTGSASGLGFSMAKKCLELGMHIVLSDVRKERLGRAVEELKRLQVGECRIEGFMCDVTELSSVEEFLRKTREAFVGLPIQFLAANAGVLFPKSTVLSGSSEEWDLTYKVNVQGVVNTLRTFVPVLLEEQARSVIEITASAAGVIYGMLGPYGTSKLAAMGVAEALHFELQRMQASKKIKVVALCPGIVATELLESGEHVTGGAIAAMEAVPTDPSSGELVAHFKNSWEGGMTPDYVVNQLMEHVQEGRFYCILEKGEAKQKELNDMIQGRSFSMVSRGYPGSGKAKL